MDREAHDGSRGEKGPRPPEQADLTLLCGELNRLQARYIVVGGLAIIEAGFLRTTTDIDLLIDASLENEQRVFQALRLLPDKAVDELEPGDVERYTVVRVGDAVVVDLLKNSCGVTYADAIQDAVFRDIGGVLIPFASPASLWRMKQTVREKDAADRAFLRKLLEVTKKSEPNLKEKARQGFWERIFGRRA